MNNRVVDIITFKGERYSYDQETGRIFKDGEVAVSSLVEPVFSHFGNPDSPPKFSGIYFKEKNEILTLSGKINKVVSDINIIK